MNAYEKITYQPEGADRPKRVILHHPAPCKVFGNPCTAGTEVNEEGDEIKPRGADERRHIIQDSLIKKRVALVFSRNYGTLEPKQRSSK